MVCASCQAPVSLADPERISRRVVCRTCGTRHDLDVLGGAGDGPLRGAADLALVRDEKAPPATFTDLSGGRFTRFVEVLDLRGPTAGRPLLLTGAGLLFFSALLFAVVVFIPGRVSDVLRKLLAISLGLSAVSIAIMLAWSRPIARRAVILDARSLRELRNNSVVAEVPLDAIDHVEADAGGLLAHRGQSCPPLQLVRGAHLDAGDLRWLADHLNRGLAVAKRRG